MTTTACFTCATCRVLFSGIEEQRDHYRSEWHRYNLRRKVSDLPPLSEAAYHQKLTIASNTQAINDAAIENASRSRECRVCRKNFASAAAFDNHVQSRRHQENLAKFKQEAAEVEVVLVKEKPVDVAIDAGVPVEKTPGLPSLSALPHDPTDEQIDAAIQQHMSTVQNRLAIADCLFCPCRFEALEASLAHMQAEHSFYIPDSEYLKDLPGLLRHLADKVSVWYVCLACGSETRQPFASLEACRKHMLSKGHNKIRFDEEGSDELADFYDYSSLRPSAEAEEYDSDDFVTDDEGEEGEFSDHDNQTLILSPDESELVLPNGARLGSRVYRHYYRQNLLPYLDAESRPNALRSTNAPRPDGTVVRGQHYVPPPRPMDAVEQRDSQHDLRHQKSAALRMGVRGNGLQKHFREQLLQ